MSAPSSGRDFLIQRIDLTPIEVPLIPERIVKSARGVHDRSPFVIVEVVTKSGVVGLGEVSCTPGWSGEDGPIASHVIRTYLAPLVIGEDSRDVHRLAARIARGVVGHHFAKAGLEMALWDLLGKSMDQPLYRLLGGPTKSTVRTKFSIGAWPTDRVAGIASWARSVGFDAMKVKVATPEHEDLARYEAARAAAGPEVLLGVDANCGWSRWEAKSRSAELVAAGAAFVEQPLRRDDLAGLADLRATLGVPLVLDESTGTPDTAIAIVRAGAADVLSIYVGMAGGIAGARRIGEIAHAAGLGWMMGSNLELGIGMAAHLHVALSTPGLADDLVPCDVISPFYYQEEILSEGPHVEGGSARPSDRPGLGVVLDRDMLEKVRTDR